VTKVAEQLHSAALIFESSQNRGKNQTMSTRRQVYTGFETTSSVAEK